MIDVENLTKSYGKGLAVDDISFKVERGEILGFLGPNGAGKTTTMRILTGYLPATAGTARIAGYDVFEQSLDVRRRIGYLPETPPLYPDMTVKAYLEFVSRIKGVAAGDIGKRVNEAMRMTNITDKRDDLIKKLSRGYRQRVGIAQALVHNPDVVILDEPTVGLDPKQIIEVRHLIKGLAGEHTIILSTHILPEVSMTCDRVIIINKGKLVAEDTPEQLTTSLKGRERVRLEVKGEGDAVRSALGEVEGVLNVEVAPVEGAEPAAAAAVSEAGEGDALATRPLEAQRLAVTVESEAGRDLRSALAARVVTSGFELYELRALTLSLEDIFLQLTTEEPKAAPAVAAKVEAQEEPEAEEEEAEAPETTEEVSAKS